MNQLVKNRSIENVVFDFGGVLVDWDPHLSLQGAYPDGVIDMFLDPTDEWGFWRYNELSHVGWSESKILNDYESTHGPAVAWVFRTYFEGYRKALKRMMPGMGELLEELQSNGIHLWGLTNSTKQYVDAMFEMFAPMRLLEGTVISSQEGLRKPDKLVYQVMLRRFQIEPERTVFVDDCPKNVNAAQQLGIRSFVFRDSRTFRTQLRELGI